MAVLLSFVFAAASAVQFVECEKCDKRMRIAEDGRSATINLCRLRDDKPDEQTLELRKLEMQRRAEMLMRVAEESRKPSLKKPLMGWSSWNTFGVNISEEIICDVARAMATNGLKAAGYTYVNIDDGFFYGHGPDGKLRFHPKRFPRGMKPVVDTIHALGLKAGTYSDAGTNTCGSMWNNDVHGVGAGLYGHDAEDCRLHFNELGFDFIKVDYCGAQDQKLDERKRYTEIAQAIRATGREVRFNICRWAFPGTWASDIAESWRTTRDIRANWASVRELTAENLYLGAYVSPGHYNDLDMLEVGHRKGESATAFGAEDCGLTQDEEITHFGLWCLFSSPLLIGCDIRKMPAETLQLVTNPFLLAMNQNELGLAPYVVRREGDAYVLVKDADTLFGAARYVALYNGGEKEHVFRVTLADLDLSGRVAGFDLVERADIGVAEGVFSMTVAPHVTRFLRLDAEQRLDRVVYEAEDAYITSYTELTKKPFFKDDALASGGVSVLPMGGAPENDLIWKNVKVSSPMQLSFACRSEAESTFVVEVDGASREIVTVKPTKGAFAVLVAKTTLSPGVHTIRLSNVEGLMPEFDQMRLVR